MKASEKITLREDVAKKYATTRHASRCCDGKWGKVDLNKVTLPTAAKLVKEGFPYLEEKSKTNETKS